MPKQGVRRGLLNTGMTPPYRSRARSPSVRRDVIVHRRLARDSHGRVSDRTTLSSGIACCSFLIRRLIVAFLVAATVMTLAFILTRLSGDLAISIAGPNATQADIEAIRKAYGLDRPVLDAVLRLGRPRRRPAISATATSSRRASRR